MPTVITLKDGTSITVRPEPAAVGSRLNGVVKMGTKFATFERVEGGHVTVPVGDVKTCETAPSDTDGTGHDAGEA